MRVASRHNERGVALVATLMAMLVILGLMAGAFAAMNADQRLISIDRDQTQAYAAAHAGLEKLTSDLASLFITNVSPTVAQITELTTHPPEIGGFHFIAPGEVPVQDETATSGYRITWNGSPNPTPIPDSTITAGPYQGLKGMLTPYTITVTARSATGGSEVRLRRELQTVAVPVFQFGVFSQGDLTFYAGEDFDFGGRVHTNGNLFLSQLTGQTLTFRDKITAVNYVVRSHLSNNEPIGNVGFNGTVRVIKTFPATFDVMGPLDDSVKGNPATPWPVNNNEGSTAIKGWTNISSIKFNGNIKNGLTGARVLDLPLVQQGAEPIDLIRRPAVNDEDTSNPTIFGQRFFTTAGLRILLSDRDTDITNLPTVSAGAPVQLTTNWFATPPAGYGPVDADNPPIALSTGPISNVTAAGSTYAAPFSQIFVTAPMHAGFQIPAAGMTLNSTLGMATPVTCTGKTATTFIGCNIPAPGLAVNGTISVVMPSGVTVAAPTTLAVAAGANRTITLSTATTAFPTQPFSLNTFSVNGTIVTCEGYNTALAPPRFTNCRGLTGAPGNNLPVSMHMLSNAGEPLLGGFIKIERKVAANTWTDVTMEILNYGIGAPNQEGTLCADPTPNAIIRLQRLRDNAATTCLYGSSQHYYDWWPNVLYDGREANFRDVPAATVPLEMGGIMHYVSLDVNNLRRWLTTGELGGSGNLVPRENGGNGGYIVYFSDHRGDHRDGFAGDPETGEYGYEDTINRNSATGVPNGGLDLGEDVNGNNVFDIYGGTPWAGSLPAGAAVPYNAATTHTTNVTQGEARVNKAVLFRRALKLVNGGIAGGINSLPAQGLTIATDNPVYVQGNYNATNNPNLNPDDNATQPNAPASVLADAVTLLSSGWRDARSFRVAHDRTARPAVTTGYRFAVVSGKGLSFPLAGTAVPAGTFGLFGTDGGMGNFLRLLEDWQAPAASINYRGSVVSLFISRQATGTFRFGPNVYVYNTRNFFFDNDFLQPALLPPGTPMFRDVNTLNFRQILRPNQ